jgi:hypothetical protein
MKPLSLDIRESKLLLLSLFFILFPQSILADEYSGMHTENRIVADLFYPYPGERTLIRKHLFLGQVRITF